MEQYIPKSALVAEIENLLDKGKYCDNYECAFRDGNNAALYALKERIDTLEVKEVDSNDAFIEKVLDYIENNIYNHYDGYHEYGICSGYVKKEEFIEDFKKYLKGE